MFSKIIVLLLLMLGSNASLAYQWLKNITELEYLSATPMCKRSIAIWNANHRGILPFAPSVTRKESEKPENWNSGDFLIWNNGGWHYCGGVIRIARGERNEMSPEAREDILRKGLRDCHFTWSSIPKDESWAADIGTTIARGHLALREYSKSLEFARIVTDQHPSHENAYIVSGMAFYRQEKYDDSLQYFQRALEASDGRSGQAAYFIGLAEVKLGNLESAKHYATEADKLGYTLPGLKNLIARQEASSNMK